MKHLKQFNEEVKFEWEWDPECVRLQNIINTYNNKLINDKKWKNFYHNIPLYYQKQKDSEFLESIIEFGKKRIIEIQQENEDDIKDIKEIFQDIEDSCEGIIDSIKIYEEPMFNEETKLVVRTHIGFNSKTMKDRKKIFDTEYFFTNDEIQLMWPNIIRVTSMVESMGFQVGLNYRPNMVEMVFVMMKKY